jgi:hypothetical protein
MNKISIIILTTILIMQGCGMSEQKKAAIQKQEKEKATRDSIELAIKILNEREKARKDSITSIEQNIAIGPILFNITEKAFNKKKDEFLQKCRLPDYEFYKGLTIFTYKIGEYGFGDLYGWFHNDSLYNIQLRGPIVDYDDYDRVMPDQYKALTSLLKGKFGEPSTSYGLPNWTDLDKGYFRRCDIWEIGTKQIEVQIACEGVKYYLNLEVFKPEVERRIQQEKEIKEKESTKQAVDLL